MAKSKGVKRLMIELKDIKKDINHLYSVSPSDNNILLWKFIIIGPPDTFYEGGLFSGSIIFKDDYPSRPPKVIFDKIIHPNIYKSGHVCISMLHEGYDSFGYEEDIERWLPTHGINTIMISIISMLSSPNFESPANVEASKLCKEQPEIYKKKIYKLVALSQS